MDPFSIGLGLLSAGTSIFGSYAKDDANRQQLRTANKQRKQDYRQRLAIHNASWNREVSIYSQRKQDYKAQLALNNTAAQNAYVSQQMRLNEIFKGFRFEAQDASIQQDQSLGKIQASGQAGKSVARLSALTQAVYQRNQAIRDASYQSAVTNAELQVQSIADQTDAANRRAYAQVSMPPTRTPSPLAPTLYNQPSRAGLMVGVADGLIGGFSTAMTAHKNEWFV